MPKSFKSKPINKVHTKTNIKIKKHSETSSNLVHDEPIINEEIDWKEEQFEEDNQQIEESEENNEYSENIEEEEGNEVDDVLENERNLEEYQEEIGNRGVVYMSRVPPYMTPNYIRKLLEAHDVERIYLLPESDWARKNRIKHGGSKRICFREGWIEFNDKKAAKMAALTLNAQKMVHKKGSFYSEDVWNLKYLPKFKWHHLTEKLAHEERLKKERLRLEMDQERKMQEYYTTQAHKSKTIGGIVQNKISKGKELKNNEGRSFGQKSTLEEEQD